MFEKVGQFVSRYPRLILLGWALLIVVCFPFAGRVGEVLTGDVGYPADSEAIRVRGLLSDNFAGGNTSELLLVATTRDDSVDLEGARRNFEGVLRSIEALAEVASVTDAYANTGVLPTSDLGRAQLALLNLSATEDAEVVRAVGRIQALLPAAGEVMYYLTGGAAIDLEIQAIAARDAFRAEVYGLPVSLIVLTLAFGAVVAAALPLLVALGTITLSLAALFAIGQFGAINAFALTVVTMLGLATGIDYALLMVNRYREEYARKGDAVAAACTTTMTAGKAATFSGLTVVIALIALLVPPLNFVRSIGLASMLVVSFSVIVSLTALPALLTLLGHRVNWLKVTRRNPGTRSRRYWKERARFVLRRPWLWTVIGTLVIIVLSLPVLRMQVAFTGVRGLTEDTSARRAHTILEELNLDGLLRSFDLVLDFGERGFYHPSSVLAVSRLTRQVAELPLVEHLYSPTGVDVAPLFLRQYYATPELALASPLADLARLTVSENGRYVLLRVFPPGNIVPSQSQALAQNLRALVQARDLPFTLGGDYIIESEWVSTLYRSFPWAVALVYLLTFIVLGLAFRSVVIPIKSIILNTFSVGAAFGIITAVFQFGWGARLFGLSEGIGFIESSVPIFIFAIIFGLSIDYEVFVVSRIVENHQRGLDDYAAVLDAVSTTGGVVTSAALVMTVVFTAFLFSNVVLIKTLSLGLTVAVLLDATLVRLTLVPAVMLLAGRWNWWMPKPMARLADSFDFSHD